MSLKNCWCYILYVLSLPPSLHLKRGQWSDNPLPFPLKLRFGIWNGLNQNYIRFVLNSAVQIYIDSWRTNLWEMLKLEHYVERQCLNSHRLSLTFSLRTCNSVKCFPFISAISTKIFMPFSNLPDANNHLGDSGMYLLITIQITSNKHEYKTTNREKKWAFSQNSASTQIPLT